MATRLCFFRSGLLICFFPRSLTRASTGNICALFLGSEQTFGRWERFGAAFTQ